jgi:hypothetical protein
MFATTHFSKPFSFSRFQRFFLIVALILNGIVLLYKFGPRGWLLPTSVSKATLRPHQITCAKQFQKQFEAFVPAARVVAWEQ